MQKNTIVLLVIFTIGSVFAGCGGAATSPAATEETTSDTAESVSGTAAFILGGTAGENLSTSFSKQSNTQKTLVVGDEYLVSPSKAQITFTSVDYKGLDGKTLGTSTFTGCTVTYDSSLASGASLLDCPFTVPVGDIYEIAVYFSKTLQLLISDSIGIYTTPSSSTGYSTSAPAEGAAYVPFIITIGDGTSRATSILLPTPLSVTASSTPTLYITTDMIHTLQLKVDTGGDTLSMSGSNDPVALFGGPTAGRSVYYSGASSIGAIKVQGTPYLRVFYDGNGTPLYLIGNTCGVDGPKGAWASPPIGATIGGWLGKDSNNVLAWALPTDTSYSTYSAYFIMPEQTTLGGTTQLQCKATAAPPTPADEKTYASGAPTMATADTDTTLTLLAK